MTSTFDTIPDEITERIEHAGESETSRMLHFRLDLVREEEFESFPIRESSVEGLESDAMY